LIAGVAGVNLVVPSNTFNKGAVPVTETFNLNAAVVGSFVLIVITPVLAPSAAGLEVTTNVALPPIAIAPAGVIAETLNTPGTEDTIELTVNGPVAVAAFVIVNVYVGVTFAPTKPDPIEITGPSDVNVANALSFTTIAGALPVTVTFNV